MHDFVTMVMILTTTLENKGADSLSCRAELHTPKKMSQGSTLFSCGIMENDRWRDLSRKCPLQIEQPSTTIWDCLPDKGEESSIWQRETASTCSVTNLIKDLSLSDRNGNPSAPPSKRQCRSLSFSDEMSSCRASWRPIGSKVWTPVEKRRCYSGGSVQRYSNGFTTMQRSSSFSLPSRSNTFSSSYDQFGSSNRFGCQPCQGMQSSATYGQTSDIWGNDHSSVEGGRVDIQRSLSCSHDQISFSEYCLPSANSTPTSTPELTRRSSGLSRSRSQPCVLNDKKVGIKRRRPEEVKEQRPSLDLVKMTQNCQTFNSLSCLSTTADDCAQQNQFSPDISGTSSWTTTLDVMPGRTPACTPVPEPHSNVEECKLNKEDFSCEESEFCATEDESTRKEDENSSWRNGGTGGDNVFQLDGELDIEQIENN
ncbi:protein FAM53B isoform X1 [Varanus komodoensis]|uniref:Family with sequence similarity 53 member B n=2 Tax=Varanus komodoensis TaxID=61221 RepID=A0A8D2JHB8_VARKO|nr:protein FAM53B isoform X1 [Varanus komodoensis]XP_044301607.1 protein FAM53B isoform X1 [Varanus komodoensis]XP_044301608.1 protein FAM53B isoform X1 [Varanus komodoensis]XP_044301609.1 protein FAM53B isoform X1 [Varanus komodoensis]XP_044301610.1 protein FAM53B isoform X1 [Varanus komodoensis]XP_044301611.1 protein FAM53B isoform X1 [Varanus komodoensis]XP_044301612.1 protein FAM53B isoform X1 [Varanus komodoensis]XP_044301613.1 protein FAM53B isoform X1 [Varanus komodoensis]XP_04430161